MGFWGLNSSGDIADLTGDLPAERVTGKLAKRTIVTSGAHIPYAFGSEMSAFRTSFLAAVNGIAFLTFHVSLAHRGISAGSPQYDPPLNANGAGLMGNGMYYPIGISGIVKYRRAASEDGLSGSFANVAGSISANQISDRKHHYGELSIARVPFSVEAGFHYQFSMGLSSHTDAGTMSGVDGAAQLDTTGGTNYLLIEYEPGAVISP